MLGHVPPRGRRGGSGHTLIRTIWSARTSGLPAEPVMTASSAGQAGMRGRGSPWAGTGHMACGRGGAHRGRRPGPMRADVVPLTRAAVRVRHPAGGVGRGGHVATPSCARWASHAAHASQPPRLRRTLIGSRPAAQAGAGHGDVAEILSGGDRELMRGTAGARRHRAAAGAGVITAPPARWPGSAAPAGTRRPGPRPHDGQRSPQARLPRNPGSRRSARSGRRSRRRAPGG